MKAWSACAGSLEVEVLEVEPPDVAVSDEDWPFAVALAVWLELAVPSVVTPSCASAWRIVAASPPPGGGGGGDPGNGAEVVLEEAAAVVCEDVVAFAWVLVSAASWASQVLRLETLPIVIWISRTSRKCQGGYNINNKTMRPCEPGIKSGTALVMNRYQLSALCLEVASAPKYLSR
jgi:hypothetical protein